MKDEYLEVAKYPVAVLTIERSDLKLASKGTTEADVPGTLLNMTDFGISVPSCLGVTVKPDVDISADFKVAGSAS
jgi:hypothetical protein